MIKRFFGHGKLVYMWLHNLIICTAIWDCLIQLTHPIHIILQTICFQCELGICKRWVFCQPVQIYNIIRFFKDNGRITFLTTDNKNGILTNIDNDGVGSRIIHTEQEIKIVVHCGLLPTDTLHHPAGQW